jgi:ferredoxin/flavodoxin---NADP+ reductase
VSTLSKSYDAVALCTGMSDSKRFWHGIPNSCGADEIFGWYNQNPAYKKLHQDLSKVERLAIIGNGNVALDMARIFAKKPKLLSKDNIVPEVLGVLENTNIQEITIIGRRELENVIFKIYNRIY